MAFQFKHVNRYPGIAHGVYRGLVIRGLLKPYKHGYVITPEGMVAYVRRKHAWTTSKR